MHYPYIKPPEDGGALSEKTLVIEWHRDNDREVLEIPRLKLPKSKKRKVKEHISRHRKGRPSKK
jgi:hypothetical protein